MNLSARIREVLRPGPKLQREIVRALPDAEPKRVYYAVAVMFREGVLERTGDHPKAYRYAIAREPVQRPRRTPEQLRARKRAQEARRMKAAGRRTWAEYLADKAQQKAEREARIAGERAARKAERERLRTLRERAPKPKPAPKPRKLRKAKPVAKRTPITIPPKAPCPTKPTPLPPRRESVAEFMARGGRIERLAPPWQPPNHPPSTAA